MVARIVGSVVIATVLAVALPAGVPAQDGDGASQARPMQGIFCNTRQEIEAVVTEAVKRGGAREGLEAVNEHAKTNGTTEEVCSHLLVLGHRGDVVNTVNSPEGLLDVMQWTATAVMSPLGLLLLEKPEVWWTLAESKQQAI